MARNSLRFLGDGLLQHEKRKTRLVVGILFEIKAYVIDCYIDVLLHRSANHGTNTVLGSRKRWQTFCCK